MQSTGGGNMNAAQLARLQQQLAQYGRGQTGQQQQMMNANAMGGMGNQQQQLQQAYMQQQQLQGGQQAMNARRNSLLGGNAMALLQQQQGGGQMANANLNYMNAFNQGPNGAMDASSASGAQLAALAGINMGGNNNMQNQAANNMLLGNRQTSQTPQVQAAQPAMQGMGQMGQSNNAALLQQQIAQLQRQLEQQQQGQNQTQGGMGGMSGAMGGMPGQRRASTSSQNFGGMPSQQQQLLQQMQQMGGGNSDQFSSMAAMMQGQNASQMQQQQQQRNQLGGNLGGLNNQQDLLLQQQRQLMGGNSNSMQPNSMQNDMFSNSQNQSSSNSNDLMGGRRSSQMMQMEQLNQSMNSQSQSNNTSSSNNNTNAMGNSFNNFDMDGSTNSRASRQQSNNQGISPLDLGGNNQVGDSSNKDDAANQKSFLDGSFAGGWQSNADLPDRRRIIFSILEVIRQMRPDTNKISQKLPHMAKSLEEHLYRSAQTKEEYLDPSTLKKRLQLIAHGLELHRSTTSTDQSGNDQSGNNSVGAIPSESQQLQQYLQMQGGNVNLNQGNNPISRNSITSLGGGLSGSNRGGMDDISLQGSISGGGFGGSGSTGLDDLNDPVAQQKKKVIRQQQQRLLLLRHASKCKEGQNCKTKFCPQMMALWKHMKKCRDKNCKTPHCLSSRCVLNHYRICKSQGRTATCEVCGPVMEQIKLSEQLDSSDPLAAKPQADMPQLQQQISNFGNPQQQQQQNLMNNNAQARQQQAMQQLYQKQQQAIQQNQSQQMPNLLGMQNNMQNNLGNDMSNNIQNNMQGNMDVLNSLGGGGLGGLGSSDLQGAQNNNQLQQNQGNQQQNQQNLQQKLQQQQHVLRQLQKQQSNLLEQQQQLQEQQQLLKDPGTQQGQQLQQQSLLLQQLQRRCQQEQAIIQQELMVTMKGMQSEVGVQQGNQGLGNSSQNSQMLNNNSQNSHSSQQNQMGLLGVNNQNNQINVQSQMQALSQSHLDVVSTNTGNNNNMNQMNSLQNQLNSDALKNDDDDLLNQPLPDDNPDGDNKVDDLDNDLNVKSSDGNGNSSSDPFDSMGPLVTDTSENKDDSSVAPKVRSTPTLSRGKGARGRGGKGKRLRDIADDLLPAESAAVVRAGGSIAVASDSSRKRSAGDNGDDGPASKLQKTDDDKDDMNPSLTSSMPKGDVEQNLMMLHKGLHLTSRTITHKCLPIVQQLIDDPYGWVFRDAVDPVVFGLPDYFEVVKNPMHLLLVKKKLENAVYTDMASFERDVKLVFENAILYNGEDSEVGQLAHTMMGVFEKEYQKVCEGIKNDLQPIGVKSDRQPPPPPVNNVPCKVCGLQRRQLEPPALYCASMSCEAPRIKRNATYYTYGSNQNCWCEKCYEQLNPRKLITLDDGNDITKSRLLKSKNDSLPEECWIECDDCHCRVHQICALFNGRIAKPKSVFHCSDCEKKINIKTPPKNMGSRAADLPKCSMSEFIEQGLERSLATAYKKTAAKSNCSIQQIQKAEGLTVRVMSHIEKKHLIREEMFKRYERVGCPSDYPVHTKCIGLFQKFDGVDVLLFSMYVYEYGDECPAPNRRRVYISYLDSVQYFQPKQYRSVAYQALIVEYLRFVKKRGFHTAHIWSCPPAPGDEYVFFCHPSHQKIPQEEKLRNWYYQVLDSAKDEGVVVETTDYYDEYFNNNGEDAPIGSAPSPLFLPYFEGDYIPGEIEKILNQMTKEERKPLMPPKAAPKRSGSKRGTRSNPGSLVNQYQDRVMLRLGQTIYNMKENFIIARLRNKRFVAAADRGEDVSNWPDDDAFKPPGKTSKLVNGIVISEFSDDESDGEEQALLARKLAEAVRSSGKIGSTVDSDDQFESELFENRQLILNYCQTNHYQFDELRRAKHTTMMVLYQLHNPLAPKFVSRCGACYRDIASGCRYHCNQCANYDLCHDCHGPVTNGTWTNRGSRFTHDSRHTFSKVFTENTEISQAQQAERMKAMKPFLLILVHAAGCPGVPQCNLVNCRKMKQLFAHVKTCQQTHKKGCKICIRMLALILVHARSCTIRGSCPLPFCDRIRERNERLRRQQQLMDDRRRNAQNEFYQQD